MAACRANPEACISVEKFNRRLDYQEAMKGMAFVMMLAAAQASRKALSLDELCRRFIDRILANKPEERMHPMAARFKL